MSKAWRWLVINRPTEGELLEVVVYIAENHPEILEDAIVSVGVTPEVVEHIKAGNKIQAIKAYRENFKVRPDLKTSKEAVEDYARLHGIHAIQVPGRDY